MADGPPRVRGLGRARRARAGTSASPTTASASTRATRSGSSPSSSGSTARDDVPGQRHRALDLQADRGAPPRPDLGRAERGRRQPLLLHDPGRGASHGRPAPRSPLDGRGRISDGITACGSRQRTRRDMRGGSATRDRKADALGFRVLRDSGMGMPADRGLEPSPSPARTRSRARPTASTARSRSCSSRTTPPTRA